MSASSQSRMWTEIRRLFSSEVPVVDAPSARPVRIVPSTAPSRMDSGSDRASDGEIAAQIERLLDQRSDNANIVSGKINLLNIAEIRERMGSKWPRYEEQVHNFVRRTLERRLTDKDFFTRRDDDTYLLLFHETSDVEAKLKCALLGKELSDHFFGELGSEAGESLQVETVFTTVDGRLAREGVNLADAIDRALSTVESATAEAKNLGSGTLTAREVEDLLGMAESRFQEIANHSAGDLGPLLVQDCFHEMIRQLENVERVLAAAEHDWQPLHRRDKRSGTLEKAQASPAELIRKLIERADQAIESARSHGHRSTFEGEGGNGRLELETSYTPMWSVVQQRIGLYLCETRILINSSKLSRDAELSEAESVRIIDAVDRITLRRARSDLERLAAEGLNCFIIIPLHFDTLNRPASAERFLPVCHSVSKDLRQTVIWEVRGAPLARWTTNLDRIVEQLRPLGRAVFMVAHPDDLPSAQLPRVMSKMHATGIHGVGLELGEGLPEVQTMNYLNHFAQSAEKHKLTTYLRGVDSLSLSTAAGCSGIDHISGKIIARPLKTPRGVIRRDLDALYLEAIERQDNVD